jgi:hypothetical protein
MKNVPMPQMKPNPKRGPLTFGNFVVGVYQTWGERRAKGIVQLAIEVHMIEFRGREQFEIA